MTMKYVEKFPGIGEPFALENVVDLFWYVERTRLAIPHAQRAHIGAGPRGAAALPSLYSLDLHSWWWQGALWYGWMRNEV